MGSECQAKLFRGWKTSEAFKIKVPRVAFVKYHSGRRMEDGSEVSKAGERPTRNTIQTLVYDKADSEHHFCGKTVTSPLKLLTCKNFSSGFFIPLDERD